MGDPSGQSPPVGVTVAFELSPDETVPVLRRTVWRSRSMLKVLIATALMVPAGVLVFVTGAAGHRTSLETLGIIVVGVSIFDVLLIRWSFERGVRRASKRMAEAGPTTLTFTEDGVLKASRLSSAMTRWPAYSETRRMGDLYLLRIGSSSVNLLIPRRAFLTPGDEEVFLKLAGQHTTMVLDDTSSSVRKSSVA